MESVRFSFEASVDFYSRKHGSWRRRSHRLARTNPRPQSAGALHRRTILAFLKLVGFRRVCVISRINLNHELVAILERLLRCTRRYHTRLQLKTSSLPKIAKIAIRQISKIGSIVWKLSLVNQPIVVLKSVKFPNFSLVLPLITFNLL